MRLFCFQLDHHAKLVNKVNKVNKRLLGLCRKYSQRSQRLDDNEAETTANVHVISGYDGENVGSGSLQASAGPSPMKTCTCVHVLPLPTDLRCHVTTADELLVLEGQSVTFPCHYEPQYASYVKYWCRGRMREFCTSLARTSDAGAAKPGKKFSVVDDQVQQVFTVAMNQLTEADSGWYMCGVEIGSGWTADVASFVHIRVIHGE